MPYIPVVRADANLTAIVSPASVGPLATGWRSLSQMRQDVLNRLGGRSDLDSSEIDFRINEAYVDMCSTVDFLFLDGTISWIVEVGQSLYGLPDSVREVTLLATQGEPGFNDDGPLEKIDLPEYRRRSEDSIDWQSRPRSFVLAPDGTLALWPQPDAAYVMSMECKFRPGLLVLDTDYPVLPPEWYECLQLLAASKAASGLNEFELGAQMYNVYLGLVRSKRNERGERSRGTKGGFTVVRNPYNFKRSGQGGYP